MPRSAVWSAEETRLCGTTRLFVWDGHLSALDETWRGEPGEVYDQ